MQTVELTDVYKASAEVASLGSSDRVLVADSNGVQKKVSKNNFLGNYLTYNMTSDAGSGKWVRLFTVTSDTVGMVYLTNLYWDQRPDNVAFLISGAHPSDMSYSSVFVLKKSTKIQKARIVYSSSAQYLEVLVTNINARDTLKIFFDGIGLTPNFSDGAVPSDASVKEFNLTSISGGGVIDYSSTSYAILQKGGLRDGDGRYREPHHDGLSDCECEIADIRWRDIEGLVPFDDAGHDTCAERYGVYTHKKHLHEGSDAWVFPRSNFVGCFNNCQGRRRTAGVRNNDGYESGVRILLPYYGSEKWVYDGLLRQVLPPPSGGRAPKVDESAVRLAYGKEVAA